MKATRLLFLTLLSAASVLTAAPITITTTAIPSFTVDRTISDSTTGPQTPTSLGVGLITYQITGGGTIFAYCLEPQQLISPLGSPAVYDTAAISAGAGNVGGLNATRVNQIRLLFGQIANPFSSGVDAVTQAAIQIALWEIVRENSGTLNVTGGTTTFANASNAAALTQAQTLLNAVTAGTGTPNNNLTALVNTTFQDLLVRSQDVIIPDVGTPEPTSFVLIGTALFGLGVLRKGMKRN